MTDLSHLLLLPEQFLSCQLGDSGLSVRSASSQSLLGVPPVCVREAVALDIVVQN